jgi:hypothetical protein
MDNNQRKNKIQIKSKDLFLTEYTPQRRRIDHNGKLG